MYMVHTAMALNTLQRYLSNLVAEGESSSLGVDRIRYEILWVNAATRLVSSTLVGVFASWELAPGTYASANPISKEIIRNAIRDDDVMARLSLVDFSLIRKDEPKIFTDAHSGFEVIVDGSEVVSLAALSPSEIENLFAARIRISNSDVSNVIKTLKNLSIPPGKIILEPSSAQEIITLQQLQDLSQLGQIHPDRQLQIPKFLVDGGSNPAITMEDVSAVLNTKTSFVPTATLEVLVDDLGLALTGFSAGKELKNVQKILFNVATPKPTVTLKQLRLLLDNKERIEVRNGDASIDGYHVKINSYFELKKLISNTGFLESLGEIKFVSLSFDDDGDPIRPLRISSKQLKSLLKVVDQVDSNSLFELWVSSAESIADLPEIEHGMAGAIRINLDNFPIRVNSFRELVAKGYENVIFGGLEGGELYLSSERFPDFSYFEEEWLFLLKKIGYHDFQFSFPIQLDSGAISLAVSGNLKLDAPASFGVLQAEFLDTISIDEILNSVGIERLLVTSDPTATAGRLVKMKDTDFEQLFLQAVTDGVKFRDLGLVISESAASPFSQIDLQEFIKVSGLSDLTISSEEGIFLKF